MNAFLLRTKECKNLAKEKEGGNFFNDGVRRIDAILAYDEDKDSEGWLRSYRDAYIKNLHRWRLQIEIDVFVRGKEAYGTFDESKKQESDVRFIKVHAPFEVLCDTAEDMKMKMPIAENDIYIKEWYEKLGGVYDFFKKFDPFEIRDPATKPEQKYFVTHFDKDRLQEYINGDKPDQFFSVAERGRLVFYILEKTKFGPKELDLGVFNLQHKGVFIDAYPLHDGQVREDSSLPPVNDRQRLQADWATMKRFFKYQPIPAIKDYFGEKIALYFAWLGFYTMFLVPAAIVGFLCFLYGVTSAWDYVPVKEICNPSDKNGTHLFYMCPLCDKLCSYYLLQTQGCMYSKITHFFDNEATLFFAVFMSLWATIFLEFWKRKQVTLAYDWHTMDFEEEEERPRPEYLASVTRLKENPVTLKMEPYMPTGQRMTRLFGAFGVVVFFIILVLAAITGVIVFRAAFYAFLIGQRNQLIRQRSKIVNSACAACINLVAINLLKFIYQRIAVKITDWENPRTKTDYEDSFTVKMFWFQFVNTYSSIFYVAFFKGEYFTGTPGQYKRFTNKNFRFDGCSVQGCFLELTVQLIIIMVGQQIIGNIMEIVIPYLKNKFRDWKNRKTQAYSAADEPQWVTDFECEMQTKFSLFWQYLEIVLQYGFVTMFVAAFPLAPFFALANNLVEIRLDGVNFIHNFRRPAAERAEDIGAWYGILATLTTFSTIVNAFVLAFTSELIPRLAYKYYFSETNDLHGFTNFTLSYFKVSDFKNASRPDNATLNGYPIQDYCRYPGFHEDTSPYRRSKDYWIILAARLSFIIAFQAFVLAVTFVVAYLIPDVPKTLELKVKRENFIASEAEKNHKEKSGKRKPRPDVEKTHTHREPDDGPVDSVGV
ncbi:anoctamin-4-like isoform X2 [Hydractinia symbiolongicarpus]|uniref:anoctamin-4-like isoform X2 n=1 Tax=Hydractinia symbiolongicarpus TaxID=13093 RepID=UPI002551AEAF|nr:anoctamin-4-like isoform X2 [Hydractinia symbiolongicarpus]